ncbi:MAG: UDP-N-acetylglucosamine--N-acetylmuramyl-(pentapeptide) pyrophosphoryl-undecaprenol N-acetylglucosamine transferase [Victivallaceae bacterium]|nr:UDP-N-acetylglucosamine--N-acetylmuramyl-(pentapeptide) pyrophosphoryl-undecaprenol N-acetylglucosamine transferase [Victivallaceae bacterium]
MKIAVSCGGTGGHFYPGLALAREAGGDASLVLLSGIHAPEQKAIAEKQGLRAVALPAMPIWKRAPFGFARGLWNGFFTARKELKTFAPDAVIGMGSFASAPILLAAKTLSLPIYLHDGNARIGKANRIFSRFARLLGIAFPPVNTCVCPVSECGMPVRPELEAQTSMSRGEAFAKMRELFGVEWQDDAPLALIFGGSQGAAAINAVLPEAVAQYGKKELRIVHLTGAGKKAAADEAWKPLPNPRLVLESTPEMGVLLAAADIVVSRSGGSTVAELALFGKAAVLIPYPYAAENHQTDNARYYESSGAGSVVLQEDLSAETISALFHRYLDDGAALKAVSEKAKVLARPRAAAHFLAAVAEDLETVRS